MTPPPFIAPSLLSADFAQLGHAVTAIDQAGADWVHIDIMDGHFVPNLTIGPDVVRAIRTYTRLPFDVHLMVSEPDLLIPAFAAAGADILTVHAEATIHLDRTIAHIHSLGKQAGVSLVPSSPPALLEYVMDQVDLILVMTVNPGYGGQHFLPSQLPKIHRIHQMIAQSGRKIRLEVDGGITAETASKVREVGADTLVAGSYIFSGGEAQYAAKMAQLRR